MALNIKDAEADSLARELARQTGQTVTQAVILALRRELERRAGRQDAPSLRQDLIAISDRCADLPDHDTRSPEEILGFDDHGLPK